MSSKPILASCSDTIKFWELPSTTPKKDFNPHKKSVTSLSWSVNNNVLVSGSIDGTIAVTLRGAQVMSLEGGMGPINSVSCSSSSRLVAAGDDNGAVHVWELKNRELMKTFKVSQLSQHSSTSCVQFNASDSQDIAAGSSSGDIVLYSMTTNQTVANFQVPDSKESGVQDLKYSPFTRNILAACSDDGGIHMWDTHTRKLHTTFPHQHTAPASALAFSPANKLLLSSCGLDKKILFYDIQDRKVLKVIAADSPLTCLSFMEDGITLAAGSTQGKIFVYDLRAGGTPTHTLKAHEPFPVNAIHFQHPRSASSSSSSSSSLPSSSLPSSSLPSSSSSSATSSAPYVPPATPSTTSPTPYSTSTYYPSIKQDPTATDTGVSSSAKASSATSYSDLAAFSPIKGTKGTTAPPVTTPSASQTRNDHHIEIMLKAQRAMQHPVPSLPSGLSSKSLKALQIADDKSKAQSSSNLHSSDNLRSSPPSSPLNGTTVSKPFDSETLSATYPGPRIPSTPSTHNPPPISTFSATPHQPPSSLPLSSFPTTPPTSTPPTINFISPIFPSTPASSTFLQTPVSYPTLSQFSKPLDSTGGSTKSTSTFHGDTYQTQPMDTTDLPSTTLPTSSTPSSYSSAPPSTRSHTPPHSSTISSSHTTSPKRSASPPKRSNSPPKLESSFPSSSSTEYSSSNRPRTSSPTHTSDPVLPSLPSSSSSSSHTTIPSSSSSSSPPFSSSSPPPSTVPIQDVQRQFIKSVLDESLSEFKESIRQDVRNLHVELIRQFQLQQLEMRDMLEQYVQESQQELVKEIKALREENTLLRKRVYY